MQAVTSVLELSSKIRLLLFAREGKRRQREAAFIAVNKNAVTMVRAIKE
jgi:hypothetical protein